MYGEKTMGIVHTLSIGDVAITASDYSIRLTWKQFRSVSDALWEEDSAQESNFQVATSIKFGTGRQADVVIGEDVLLQFLNRS